MSVIIRRPWTLQPQIRVSASSYAISRQLVTLSFASNRYAAVYGSTYIETGSPAVSPINGAQCWIFDGTAKYVDLGALPANPDGMTLVAAFRQGAAVLTKFPISSRAGSGGAQYGIEFLCDGTAGQTQARLMTTSASVYNTTNATGLNDGKTHVHVASWSKNGTLKHYVDGVFISQTAATSGDVTSHSQNLRIGSRATSYFNDAFEFCCFFNTELSPSEIATVARNTGTLYATLIQPKPSRIWLPSAASGVPTLSNSTYVLGSLSSTGWRPKVTAS